MPVKISAAIRQRAARIKLFLCDVDGVLTSLQAFCREPRQTFPAGVLPHPGPLPLGEGEPFAASRKLLRRRRQDAHPNFERHRRLPPSPSGRGIEGEGEFGGLKERTN